MHSMQMQMQISLSLIDVPLQLASISATAREARLWRKALASKVGDGLWFSIQLPIHVKHLDSGRFLLIAGGRRVAIARRAGVESIMAVVDPEYRQPAA